MKIFGWIIFSLGTVVLIWGGLVGSNVGYPDVRVANIAALSIGSTLMVCGAVLAGIGSISEFLEDSHSNLKLIMTGIQRQLEQSMQGGMDKPGQLSSPSVISSLGQTNIESRFKVGGKVSHQRWGIGEVVSFDRISGYLLVQFADRPGPSREHVDYLRRVD